MHPTQITAWKAQLVEGAAGLFGAGSVGKSSEPEVDLKTLHAKIGELNSGERFFIGCARQGRASERKAMIKRGHRLPLTRQAAMLGISRGSLYYSACPVSEAELAIMRRIDELHLDYPFAGSRMLRDLLRGEGVAIGREQVASMMRRMSIEAVYRRPHTSKPADGHKVFPYLLRGMAIKQPRTKPGRWTSPIYQWPAASCTSLR